MTLTTYRTRLRLLKFIGGAEDGARNLLSASLAAGFGSYSQCHRAFQRTFGWRSRSKSASRVWSGFGGSGSAKIELNRDWTEFLSALIAHRVRFVLVGGHAVAGHGQPRLTEDLDVFVDPTLERAVVHDPPVGCQT